LHFHRLQLNGNQIMSMPPLTASMQPSLTSTVSRSMKQQTSFPVLILLSAQLPHSEVSISYLMEFQTLKSPQSQAYRLISTTRMQVSSTKSMWTQFRLSWLALKVPRREHFLSSSWMLFLTQLVGHSKEFFFILILK